MDAAIQTLLSWQFLMFCLAIAAMTFVFRKFIEYFIHKYMKNCHKFWSEVALPTIPVLLGGLIGFFVKEYPFPSDIQTASGRVFFGLVAGMFSGLVYRLAKSYLNKMSASTNK
jgi:uncharacterized membrane protein